MMTRAGRASIPATCRVRARLFYQATPPYFLRNLFTVMNDPTAPSPAPPCVACTPSARHLDTQDTPIANWKLPIVAAEAPVK